MICARLLELPFHQDREQISAQREIIKADVVLGGSECSEATPMMRRVPLGGRLLPGRRATGRAWELGGRRTDGCARSALQPTLGHLDSKPSSKSNMLRGRNSATSADEQPHIGNYRLLKTIGKGNFAKVKLARHILTGKEVSAGVGSAAAPSSSRHPCRWWLPPQPTSYLADRSVISAGRSAERDGTERGWWKQRGGGRCESGV